MQPSRDIRRLLEIMAALRDRASGCPWDIEQDFASIAPYTIEEAYEVADAIERGDMDDLREELGDLLLQVVYHAQMAQERGAFAFPDVVEAITAKMIRRHPHVFGDEEARSAGLAKGAWERIKAAEKAERAQRRGAEEPQRYLDSVPANLPALTRALKLQARAGEVGFDWQAAEPVLAKIEEEIGELREAMRRQDVRRADEVEAEFGDLLFAMVNLGRHLGLDPEKALARTNAKFRTRFAHIEDGLAAAGKALGSASLEEMEALWQQSKDRAGQDPA